MVSLKVVEPKVKAPSHKWVIPTDEEYDVTKAAFGLQSLGFIRKCERCGCMRRTNPVRNSRMYIPKGGRWSNATAQAPKCIEPKKEG